MGKMKTHKMAISGVFCALALSVMLGVGLLPFATFCAPALSGIVIMLAASECGTKTGWLMYAAVSLLSFLLVQDREEVLLFVCLLGYYPLAKAYLQRHFHGLVCVAAKLVLFNASIAVAYGLLWFVMGLPPMEGWGFPILLLVFGNITFWVYDLALVRVLWLYTVRLKPYVRQTQGSNHHR